MLTGWILLVISLGLVLIATRKLLLLWGLNGGLLIGGHVNTVSTSVYPMKMTSGRMEYELVVRYSYSIDDVMFMGVDKIRTADLSLYDKVKLEFVEGKNIKVRVASYSNNVSCIFFDRKTFAASFILLVTGVFLTVFLWLFLNP